MRCITTATLSALICFSSHAAQPSKKAAKNVPAPVAPKQGIRTPGIQIAFSTVTAEATLPAPAKPSWVFFLADSTAAASGGSGGGGGTPAAPAGTLFIPAGDKLDRIDTKTNQPGEPLAGLKKPCGGMVSAFGSLWVPTCGDGALQRIDAKTSKITATIATGAADIKGSIAASTDSIWLLTDARETLARIDPEKNVVVAEIRLPVGCNSMIFAETALWLACPEQNKILRINPATNVAEKRVEVADRPLSLASGEGSVWVLCGKDGKVDRIDPKTDKVSKSIELSVPAAEGAIAYGDGFLWVSMTGFPVTRIDPAGESVAQQFRGEGGGGIVSSSGALWLVNLSGGTVSRIDPKLILATIAE